MTSFDMQLLYQALDAQRDARNLTWSRVAAEIADAHATVAVSTIKGIRDKDRVEGDGVLQMLLWLGRTPESFMTGGSSGAGEPLRKPTSGKVLRWHTAALHAALDAKRQDEGLTWPGVADCMNDVSAAAMKNLAKGGRTSFPGVMNMLNWLKMPAARFTWECDY